TKVESGDLDAGIVYVTDVLAAGDAVEGIEIPAADNVVAEYPITTLAEAGDAEVAEAFVAYVLSDEGQAILASYGFEPA
ncbi:MAG: extracellular solute-binding protein, partial [Acidimicrobiales bacterium]